MGGCGPELPRVASLQVERYSWDSVLVVLRFEQSRASRLTRPERVAVTLFDGAYDTLYTGVDTLVAVPDGALGSSEQILVEACGIFPVGTVCEQRALSASPKRFATDIGVEFPTDSKMERGSLSFEHHLERSRFGAEGWEPLTGEIPERLTATARVLDTPDRGVRMQVRNSGGAFNLSRADGYRDFQFYLRSVLRERGDAEVEFAIAAPYRNGQLPVGTSVVTVTRKTEDEQVAEVSRLAEAAGRRILRRLSGFTGTGRAFVFVNDWEYAADSRRYRAEIELHWRSRGSRNWHELVLGLEAGEDGSGARVRLIEGSRTARRRWRSEVDGEAMELDRLEVQESNTRGAG